MTTPQVVHEYSAGDQHGFRLGSFTHSGREYNTAIDATTGQGHCDCPDHWFRKRFCKHLVRCAQAMIKAGQLPADFLSYAGRDHCDQCHGTENLHLVMSDDGLDETGAHRCEACHERLKHHDKHTD